MQPEFETVVVTIRYLGDQLVEVLHDTRQRIINPGISTRQELHAAIRQLEKCGWKLMAAMDRRVTGEKKPLLEIYIRREYDRK